MGYEVRLIDIYNESEGVLITPEPISLAQAEILEVSLGKCTQDCFVPVIVAVG